jgi:transcriptional regulator GlxA family with amidase domain
LHVGWLCTRTVMVARRSLSTGLYPKEDRPWLAKLLEWTQNHLGEKLSVKRVAKQAGMGKRTLSRRFAEDVAASVIESHIGLRLARAKHMLEKTCSSPQFKVPSKIVMKRVSRHEMG